MAAGAVFFDDLADPIGLFIQRDHIHGLPATQAGKPFDEAERFEQSEPVAHLSKRLADPGRQLRRHQRPIVKKTAKYVQATFVVEDSV